VYYIVSLFDYPNHLALACKDATCEGSRESEKDERLCLLVVLHPQSNHTNRWVGHGILTMKSGGMCFLCLVYLCNLR